MRHPQSTFKTLLAAVLLAAVLALTGCTTDVEIDAEGRASAWTVQAECTTGGFHAYLTHEGPAVHAL